MENNIEEKKPEEKKAIELPSYGTYNEKMREEWIFKKLLEIPKDSILLDAGAGDQHHRSMCPHLKYVSQDNASYNGKGNNVGLQTGTYNYGILDIVSDITSIPRDSESFDAILCSEVLEHVINPDLAIKELSRLLKMGGTLLLTAPFCSMSHFTPNHFATGFNIYWYQRILPKYGLKLNEAQAYGNYFDYVAQELHRTLNVVANYCENPTVSETEIEALKTMLNMLERFSSTGNSSWQVGTYGFMVKAEKVFAQ